MKTLFLKNGMPVATAILAIAGAFATTSMQSSSSADQLTVGYILLLQPNLVCNIPVACSIIDGPICRSSYPAGRPAYNIDPILGNCTDVLFRP